MRIVLGTTLAVWILVLLTNAIVGHDFGGLASPRVPYKPNARLQAMFDSRGTVTPPSILQRRGNISVMSPSGELTDRIVANIPSSAEPITISCEPTARNESVLVQYAGLGNKLYAWCPVDQMPAIISEALSIVSQGRVGQMTITRLPKQFARIQQQPTQARPVRLVSSRALPVARGEAGVSHVDMVSASWEVTPSFVRVGSIPTYPHYSQPVQMPMSMPTFNSGGFAANCVGSS